ncbi:hypothetical protein E1301_Tti015781 [Triplophysa tibetana]|uniref:Uncharacterized protein n=1 Tax=Triplophysa tibetana TaxID=1572043 RepID=A0A5A9NQQ6_9TELE|nr:hypothetical protein E1301_Tti015781 [Triplophysa tibetana]
MNPTLVPKPGRKERHAVGESSPPSGPAVPESSGSADDGCPPVAARSGGSGESEVHSAATVKASVERRPVLARPWVEVGWLSSKRERGSCRRPPEAEACVRPPSTNLQLFKINASVEEVSWEAQRANYALPPQANEEYEALKAEILARVGLSPIVAVQKFFQWTYKGHVLVWLTAGTGLGFHRLEPHLCRLTV